MNNRTVAGGLLMLGLWSWFVPGFSGFFFSPSDVTDGEAQIVSAIFTVGAAIVWFQRS
ncbi:MAG: hypothetical protein ACSHW1_14600 [Yoonia sp.]|uniref:hypothetical protein n=1 Tax=Yoonia sp. TaxID=2212373 RepID=UPI003EF6A71A